MCQHTHLKVRPFNPKKTKSKLLRILFCHRFPCLHLFIVLLSICCHHYFETAFLSTAPQQCPVVIDLVFLLDASSNVLSLENFERQKLFIQQIISRFNVTNSSRVSIIPYSDIPHEAKILSTRNKSVGEFAEDVRDLQLLMGGCSRHDLALDMSHSYLMNSGGPSSGQKVVVLMTTAKQPQHPQLTPGYQRIQTTTARLKDAGVLTFAIGFGDGVQEGDLKSYATEQSMIFFFEGFDNVTENAMVVYKSLCKASGEKVLIFCHRITKTNLSGFFTLLISSNDVF